MKKARKPPFLRRSVPQALIPLVLVVLAAVAAWTVAITLSSVSAAGPGEVRAEAVRPASVAPSAPAAPASPRTAPRDWLGRSRSLRAVVDTPERLSADSTLATIGVAVDTPGVHELGLVAPDGDPFYALALIPYAQKEGSRLKQYRIGDWPEASHSRYAPPAGFIEVTPENQNLAVSERFQLRDFLTHDQQDVWPKFLVLRPALLDKLELIAAELERRGLPSRLHVMSGFRTPQYNALGVGPKGGRASLSRHMYGDAADVFVDADRNGTMDDLNGDGRITVADARVLYAVAQHVEDEHPDLVGGLSPYPANRVHGPFVHVDVRGVRARW